jgi:predicted dinucleotide-binding enzyme
VTTIGIIGSGHVGSGLAKVAVAHGYDVVISNSKGPQTRTSQHDRTDSLATRPVTIYLLRKVHLAKIVSRNMPDV